MRLQTIVLFYVLFLSGCSMLVREEPDSVWTPVYGDMVYSVNKIITLSVPNYKNTPFEHLLRIRDEVGLYKDYDVIVLRRIVKNKIVEKCVYP